MVCHGDDISAWNWWVGIRSLTKDEDEGPVLVLSYPLVARDRTGFQDFLDTESVPSRGEGDRVAAARSWEGLETAAAMELFYTDTFGHASSCSCNSKFSSVKYIGMAFETHPVGQKMCRQFEDRPSKELCNCRVAWCVLIASHCSQHEPCFPSFFDRKFLAPWCKRSRCAACFSPPNWSLSESKRRRVLCLGMVLCTMHQTWLGWVTIHWNISLCCLCNGSMSYGVIYNHNCFGMCQFVFLVREWCCSVKYRV